MSKTNLLSVLSLLFLIAGCATAAPTPTPAPPPATTMPTAAPTVAKKSGTLRFYDLINLDVRDIPMLMAVDDLTAQGYKVEKTYVANSTLMAEALSRGDADVGLFNSQTAWTAIAKGAPIRTILQFTRGTTIIASKAEIRDCRELDGKRVGAANTSGATPALLSLYLKDKCGGAKPELIVISESAARSAALMAGELDASFMPGEELIKIEEQAPGKFHVLIPLSSEYANVQVDALHARVAWLQENPELARDLIRALLKANRSVAADPQLLYDESVKRLKLDPATAKKIADVHLQNAIWDANGGLTAENIRYSIDFYAKAAGLPTGLEVNDVADLSFLNAVLDEVGRK